MYERKQGNLRQCMALLRRGQALNPTDAALYQAAAIVEKELVGGTGGGGLRWRGASKLGWLDKGGVMGRGHPELRERGSMVVVKEQLCTCTEEAGDHFQS